MIFPGCMNGWNAMTKPPNGKRRSILLKLSLNDNSAKNMTMSKKHSNTIGTISLSEKTVKRIISKMATSLTLPSRLWIIVSLEAMNSNDLTCSIAILSTINIFRIINLKLKNL